MKRALTILVVALGLSSVAFMACDSEGGSAAPADMGFAAIGEGCGSTSDCIGDLECNPTGLCAEIAAIEQPGDGPLAPTWTIHEGCGFDEELQGLQVGDHVKNFSLKTVYDTEYNVHAQNCGQPNRKAIYFLLGTGWCGACEAYAKRAEVIYKEYKDQGLEILWIESEDQDGNSPTLEWLANWQDEKGTTFPLTRDLGFQATYGAMAHASTSLPHLYIVDAVTMKLVYAEGGGSKWDEAEGVVAGLLGVSMPMYDQ